MKRFLLILSLLVSGCSYDANDMFCGWDYRYEKTLPDLGDERLCIRANVPDDAAVMPELVNSCDVESFQAIYRQGDKVYLYSKIDLLNEPTNVEFQIVECPH